MQYDDFCAYAADISARLLRMIDGDPALPRTWIWMNNQHGIPVTSFFKRHGRRGCFTVDDRGRASICYNTAYPVATQVRVLIHESAHALLAADSPLPETDIVANYDDPLADDRHRLCRRVEHIVLRGLLEH